MTTWYLNQIINWKQTRNLCLGKFTLIDLKRPEPGYEPRTSGFLARPSTTWSILVLMPAHVHFFLLRSYNVNFPRHKLRVCIQLIIWFEYHIHVKGEVSSLVVNIMADSVMTAPPVKKWHPSQEGDLNMSWHENQDSSSGRAPG